MIKKITLFLCTLCVIFQSCTEDIEVNTPALQATMDGHLFRPADRKAILHDDGRLEIFGNSGSQKISISTYVTHTGTYQITTKSAPESINQINYTQADQKYGIEEGISEGEIVITDIFDSYVSGHFSFKSLKTASGQTMDVENGWFYMLPIVPASEVISNPDETPINPCLLNASLSADVDGEAIVSTIHKAEAFGVREPFPSIRITAGNGAETIEIVFAIETDPGTFDLTGSGDYSATYTNSKEKSAAVSGTLTIIEHDKETQCISGTFAYTTASGIVVTNGQFDFGY